MSSAFGIITFAQSHINVEGLLKNRAIGAFSFLGRYRVIDFPISNMSNSGISHIHTYINCNPRSLTAHIGSGRNFNINSKSGKLRLLYTEDRESLYNTNINAYRDNIEFIMNESSEYVVITPAYMVFTQDFDALLDEHINSGADITLLYHATDKAKENYLSCDVLNLNKQNGVLSIERNSATNDDANIFMDTYVMKKQTLIDIIHDAKDISAIYTLTDMVNLRAETMDVRAVSHRGYFASITDFKSYYDANIELTQPGAADSLISESWPIYTRTNDSCPTQYFADADVKQSFIANGSKIEGTVCNSVVGRDTIIKKGAVVKNCVISSDVVIGEDVHVENMVVDRNATLINAKEVVAPAEAPGFIDKFDTL